MITTSLKRSIGTQMNMYNKGTMALMNINDTNLLLLLQNLKVIKKIEKRFNRHFRKYIIGYEDDIIGMNYR